MDGSGVSIIATILSSLTFSFLWNILDKKIFNVFKAIQVDLDKLNNGTRRILKILGFLLVILITVFLRFNLGIGSIESGLILGFLGSIVDTCFR